MPAAPPVDRDEAQRAAYTKGLRLLAMRELSEAALRARLTALEFDEDATAFAVARLRETGALDEHRAVRAVARTLVLVKRRGRLRAQRELEARGFDRALVAETLREVLPPDDERASLARAAAVRLRGRAPGSLDQAARRRLGAALIRQGFSPALVSDLLRSRGRRGAFDDDATDE